ncbi:MAG: MFS transporter [Patescibacteria group bacterium]
MLARIKHRIGEFLPALRSHNYRLYFVGQGISLVGTWLQNVAEAWLIYPVLTNNRSLLGIVSAINLAPHFLFVLFAGVLVETWHKRRSLIAQQILYAGLAFVMFFLVFTKQVQVWHVMLIAFGFGLVFAFEMPTRQTLMLSLVEKKDYPSAISLNAAIFNAARAIGPAIAGVSIATIGIAPAYFLNSLSFLAVIVAVLLMRLPRQEQYEERISVILGLKESFIYLIQNKVIVVLLLILLLQTLFSWPLATLLPVFAKDVFHRGEVGFGLLQSAFGAGAVVGALGFSTLFSVARDKYKLLQLSIFGDIAAILVFSISPIFPLALLAQFCNGLLIQTIISTSNTLIQLVTPDTLRSRMLSFYSFVLVGGMPFGALLGSLGVVTVGPRLTVALSSILLALASFSLIAATRGKFQEKLQLLYNTDSI